MTGLKGLALGGLAALCTASAIQDQVRLGGFDEPQVQPLSGSVTKKPLVDSEKLQSSISTKNLLARAEHLYEIAKLSQNEYNHPTRVIGSKGHLGTLAYIYETLAQLGDYYTLSKQPFVAVTGNVYESRLNIGHDQMVSASPMALTPPTKNKQPVSGSLVLVSNTGCKADDYPKEVEGNIAFIIRGECSFGTKSEFAGKAGAIAAVIYNNGRSFLQGTLGTPVADHVATFGLSGKEAEEYVEKLKGGDQVSATAYVDADVLSIITDNIVAQTTEGDPDNCVMLGAHSDSVPEGPGINDDGSGTLTLLEVATQLTNFTVNNCVRFAWWSAEEEGLLGSDYYVSTLSRHENKKIRLFMDYDMLASPNFAYQVYDARNGPHPTGSQELRDLYVDWYTSQGLNYTFIPFDGRSDYDGFIRHGIPAGGIATGAEGIKSKQESVLFGGQHGVAYDVCYHALCDDVSNLNLTAWELNTQLVAHSVATYARSFEGFPEREERPRKVDSLNLMAESDEYEKTRKYRGHKLAM